MKRVEVTVSFTVPDIYMWPDISERTTAIHEAVTLLAGIKDVDIVNVEVASETDLEGDDDA